MTSSVVNKTAEVAGSGETSLFKEEAVFFLFEALEEVYFIREETTFPSAAAEDALTVDLGFFVAGLYGRS